MNKDVLHETESFLHEQIPLTQTMGVRVESYNGDRLILTAPLEPNHNHLGTAFGGSLSALTTLAGYAMLWLQLGDRRAHIVIRESSIRYRHPVPGPLRAICRRPEEAVWQPFLEAFKTAGKGRIKMAVHIVHAEETCVEFAGEFVALS